jgi:hypothetical protein
MRYSLDRRVRDENGHMHVAGSVITSGVVSNYLASEVEGSTERGYTSHDLIPIYRDPAELKKAIDSANSIPLLRRHIMVSADDPQKDDIIGVVTNPSMDGSDMVADLTFWSAEDGIDPVVSGEQAELSCGYTRDLDWTPGEVDGLHYVARMTNIKFNHCATVIRGRVSGARVADEKPAEFSMSDKLKFPRIMAALQAALGLKPEHAAAVDSALAVELAEKVDPEAVAAELKAAADAKTAEDTKLAEQAAAQDAVIKSAVDSAVASVHALYAAREAVSVKVGVTALDSAEATYRFALDKSGADHSKIAADALPALWEATVKVPAKSLDIAPEVTDFDLSKLFPGSTYIRKG